MKKDIQEISKALNLENHPQDWGIINASSGRVAEFIEYFNDNKPFSKSGLYELSELIIASMNEAILENKADNYLYFLFKEFLYANMERKDFQDMLSYWKSISNEEEFPIGFLL